MSKLVSASVSIPSNVWPHLDIQQFLRCRSLQFFNLSLGNDIHTVSFFAILRRCLPSRYPCVWFLCWAQPHIATCFGYLKDTSNSICPKLHSLSLPRALPYPTRFMNQKPEVNVWCLPHPPCPIHYQALLILSLKYSFNRLLFSMSTHDLQVQAFLHLSLYSWHNLLTGLPVIHTASSLSLYPSKQSK